MPKGRFPFSAQCMMNLGISIGKKYLSDQVYVLAKDVGLREFDASLARDTIMPALTVLLSNTFVKSYIKPYP